MKIFTNKDIKKFFAVISLILIIFFLISELLFYIIYGKFSLAVLSIFLLMAIAIWTVCLIYFRRQDSLMKNAVSQIQSYLDGDTSARIECDEDGELYQLFHSINILSTVLNAHVDNEVKDKEFLKNTISDISHQLKTPLAALNIYNSLIQDETAESSNIKEFATLSEKELERIETLIQNMLKITRMDAGSVAFEKSYENIQSMMADIELHFAYRAKQEEKNLILSGDDKDCLFCDRDWMIEAISNIVKNAFDHTKAGDTISVEWQSSASIVQIKIKDTGSGIHPEDLYHIFKRFYRSRFSKDTQGIGLGLPLAKAIIESHNGTIEVDSELGTGTVFCISFLITTKL